VAEDSTRDSTICRCEDVTASAIAAALAAGARSPTEIKVLTRAGMGACQGRVCRYLVEALVAEATGLPPEALVPASYRPPVRLVRLDELARQHGEHAGKEG